MEHREYDMFAVADGVRRLKNHLRITSDDLDSDLEQKFKAAARFAEHQTGLSLIPSTFSFESSFSPVVRLRYPLIEIDTVGINGENIPSDRYSVDMDSATVTIPQELCDGAESVSMRYRAGMGSIPEDIMAAILLKASAMFSNPVDSVEVMTTAAQNLLRPYRR